MATIYWRGGCILMFLPGKRMFSQPRSERALLHLSEREHGGTAPRSMLRTSNEMLGFLGTAQSFLGIISFGIGMIISADAAFRIFFEDATIKTFQWVFISYMAINEILLLSPLLLFAPLLFRTRLEWLRHYDALAFRYDRAFHEKWVNNSPPPEEPLLGTSDIQSLADLGNSIDRVRAMKAIPFDKRLVLHIAVMSALPGLPTVHAHAGDGYS